MTEYQKGDFCKAMDCKEYNELHFQKMNGLKRCIDNCPHTAYDFHNWIIERGGRIVFNDNKG